jgi:GTPase Era involved in 16S rRNA processing
MYIIYDVQRSTPQHIGRNRIMGTARESVTLRTGKEVPEAMVQVTMMSLRLLMESDTVAFYELVMLARNPQHELWGGTGDRLEELSLASDGKLHDITRDVILAATEGEELGLRLVNPVVAS